MLILTSRPDESTVIETPGGDCIKVTVVSQRGNQVSVGTDVPVEYTILREELMGSSH